MDNLIIKQNEIDNKLKIIEDKLLKHFTCDICGKVSISLGLHGRHMRDIHTDSTYNDKWIVMTNIKKQLLVDKKLLKRQIKDIKNIRKNCPYCNTKSI